MDSGEGLTCGRPHGGLGILWRKSLGQHCKVITYDDNRIMGLELVSEHKKVLLLNVYLPYDDGTNLSVQNYQQYLSKLESIMSEYSSSYCASIGDFNANVSVNGHRFGKELKSYCNDENLCISDCVYAARDTFIFLNEAHGTVAWLDHVVSTQSFNDIVESVWADYKVVASDHFPMFVNILVSRINMSTPVSKGLSSGDTQIKWSELTDQQIAEYRNVTEHALSLIKLNHSLILCDSPTCNNPEHTAAISLMYNNIVDALLSSAEHLQQRVKRKFNPIPCWNDLCKDLHEQARDTFLMWCANGKPRTGPIFQLMRSARARFKLVFRQCKSQESTNDMNRLALKLMSTKPKDFWKEFKRINNANMSPPLAATVSGCCGEQQIADMWGQHYKTLLNSSNDTSKESTVMHCLQQGDQYTLERFSPLDVSNAVKMLKLGKSPGLDKLCSEHVKFAHHKVMALLSLVFNCMLIHGYLPKELMDTVIVPIVKDKKGDLGDKDNYRPVALTCILSKVFELTILKRYEKMLCTSNNQFGFKQKLGADMCVFTMKQIINFYTSLSSPVYICFLDASKAFDRVNHWILCHKLLKKIPIIIVRFLLCWYRSQQFIVRWAYSLSQPFTVSNGVRQGGILSPILFNFYVDEISIKLQSLPAGCKMNSVCFNHLIYADDTVLLAPSPNALQRLIDECNLFAKCNDLIYNVKKSKVMCVKPSNKKRLHVPQFELDGKALHMVDNYKYLGVILTNDEFDDMDIRKEMRSLYARGNSLIRKFKKCNDEVKSQLFKAFCSSFYCCQLWCLYKEQSIKKLHIAHNNIFRLLFNVHGHNTSISALFVANEINNFKVIMRKLVFSFKKRILACDNPLVKSVINSLYFRNCSLSVEWKRVLFL
jgi:hypothetical protein